MNKVIVTGGAGFIGSNLVDKLIELNFEVIVFDDLSTGKKENINSKAFFYELNIYELVPESKKYKKFVNDLKDVKFFFHTAAKARVQPSIDDPISFNKVNVDGTLNMLCLARDLKVKRFIYSASSSAYGNASVFPTPEDHPINPMSPYGLQKYIGEEYCDVFNKVYGLDTVSLRYFNVYGERMLLEGAYCLVIGIFAQQMINNEPLTINNDGNQRRDFTYVGDVVNANILAANFKGKLNAEVFNIGNGKNFSVNELAKMFGGKFVYKNEVLEPYQTLADNSKARKILGWKLKGDLPTWIEKYKKIIGI